jgi:hypothetical protein
MYNAYLYNEAEYNKHSFGAIKTTVLIVSSISTLLKNITKNSNRVITSLITEMHGCIATILRAILLQAINRSSNIEFNRYLDVITVMSSVIDILIYYGRLIFVELIINGVDSHTTKFTRIIEIYVDLILNKIQQINFNITRYLSIIMYTVIYRIIGINRLILIVLNILDVFNKKYADIEEIITAAKVMTANNDFVINYNRDIDDLIYAVSNLLYRGNLVRDIRVSELMESMLIRYININRISAIISVIACIVWINTTLHRIITSNLLISQVLSNSVRYMRSSGLIIRMESRLRRTLHDIEVIIITGFAFMVRITRGFRKYLFSIGVLSPRLTRILNIKKTVITIIKLGVLPLSYFLSRKGLKWMKFWVRDYSVSIKKTSVRSY